jgi:tetratricopeptide (TPR) repeat protein
MTKKSDRKKPQNDENEALAEAIDRLMGHVRFDVAESIRLCAIPHWFNLDILTHLRGEDSPSKRSHEILLILRALTFVAPYGKLGWRYHKWIRNLLLAHWTEKEKPLYKEISLRLADYFEQTENGKHELIYHLLCAGDRKGFEIFKDEVSQANQMYRYSTSENLLNLTQESCADLSQEQRWYIQYYKGELAAVSGDWDDALALLTPLHDQDLPEGLLARVFARMGTAYNRLGKWRKAVSYYQRCLHFGEKVDPDIRAWTYTGLGLIFEWQGKWQEAKDCNNSAIRIAERINNRLWISRAFTNLGEIYHKEGRFQEALDYLEKSIQIKMDLDDQYGLIWSYINLGSLYIDLKAWDKASNLLSVSLKLARELDSLPEEAWALECLGKLYQLQGHYDEAAKYLIKGMYISEKLCDEYRKAKIEESLGRLQEDQENYREAMMQFQQALEIYKRLEVYEADRLEDHIRKLRTKLSGKNTDPSPQTSGF